MIETKRTTLRPIEPKDNQEVFNYRSDAETNKFQGWIPRAINEVDEFIKKNPNEFNEPGTWFQLVIVERESDKIIGDLGIHFVGKHQVEVGCTLSKSMHGKGFAAESLTAVIDYLFRKLKKHRIITSIDPLNTSSIKLVEKLHFRKEAHFIESLFKDGQWVDDIIYAILEREWNQKPTATKTDGYANCSNNEIIP